MQFVTSSMTKYFSGHESQFFIADDILFELGSQIMQLVEKSLQV
jgi:hypothetical protein